MTICRRNTTSTW